MKKTLLTLLLLSSSTLFAVHPGDWHCYAFDYQGKSFEGMGETIRASMADARKNCIAHAGNPSHCKTAQSYCEQNNPSYDSERCVASDGSGKSFNATGPNPCDVAMRLCTEWKFTHGNSQRSGNCHIIHY